jgi:hypothetical protein
MKLRYYVDTEFIENGRTIDLVSIGVVCEDGRELYLQSTEFEPSNANPWVEEHVFSQLLLCPHVQTRGERSPLVDRVAHEKNGQCVFYGTTPGFYPDCPWRTREQIKQELLSFMGQERYDFPELWGWCSSYDFVALCQVFGTMMNVPINYPHYMRDIQQVLDERGITDDLLPQPEGEAHNALVDARQIKTIWEMLSR